MNEGGERTRFSIAEVEVCGAASGHVGDDRREAVIGTRAKRAETFQPGVNRGDDGTAGPLQENLKKTVGVEACRLRTSSDGKDGALALSRNVTA